MDYHDIARQARGGLDDLLRVCGSAGLFVVGCSTSAIAGYDIGTRSSAEIAEAVMSAVLPALSAQGLCLAAQCCEHLNRALVVERAAMEKYALREVWVRPWLRAGGAFAARAMACFDDPVVVEDIRALGVAGMDIGGTFIGMHLRPVVVPIHSPHKRVGEAVLSMARTRPRYIGGPRAEYAPAGAH